MIKNKLSYKEGENYNENFVFVNHKELAKCICSKYNINKKTYFLFLKLLKKVGFCTYNTRGCYLSPLVKEILEEKNRKEKIKIFKK